MTWKSYDVRFPPGIVYGLQASSLVGMEAAKLGRKALLVAGNVVKNLGYVDVIKDRVKSEGVEVITYIKDDREPTVEHVEAGLKLFSDNGCDLIIALGGGSAIDTAKAIGILATNGGTLSDYMGMYKVKKPIPPLVAIPTTSGTGSEVTRFTVITNPANNVKMLIGSPLIIPSVAIDDPELTITMPPKITAATGIDAFTHAIEAYISKRSHPLSDTLARSAIRRIARYIRRAWAVPEDIEARSQMMLGSLEAGLAFSNSSVTIVHGMSRPIGAIFGVPHGISNALLLPTCMEFCMVGSLEKFADIAELMGEDVKGLPLWKAAEKAVEAIRRLCEDLQIPKTVTGLGIDKERFMEVIPKMAEDALASGSPANAPRVATKEDIMELYRRVI
ncbi:MAG: hypothetical protein PWQ16_1585 [bacterium]|nr:MAG: Iron-containing alcohol dehydrogenase [bacterium 42_11]MDK2872233.1 hypothetical protein [bacterium]